jgi:hypothetical protein
LKFSSTSSEHVTSLVSTISTKGISTNKAEGLYTTLAYRITPKIQVVGRYDQYRPNLNISDNMQKEYSAGINYFIKGQALKLMLNYVYCNNIDNIYTICYFYMGNKNI